MIMGFVGRFLAKGNLEKLTNTFLLNNLTEV